MSLRYKGAVISATPPTTTGGESGVASGSWTLEQQFQAQGAGNWPTPAPDPSLFIENLFSTYLYTGNGTSQTITNGIDLSTKGGLVWIKDRSNGGSPYENALTDTVRGATNEIQSDTTAAQTTNAERLTSFNSNGFSVGSSARYNSNTASIASWTFRKQPKFFDVVTYTGNGGVQNIAHNLGSVPGCIIVKSTSQVSNWAVYHTSLGNTKFLALNQTNAATTLNYWNDTSPTSTQFTVNGYQAVGSAGQTYVAYLFAHNAGGFGLTGTDNVISCGSYTGNGSATGVFQNLGFEPQWILTKCSSLGTEQWHINDNMRGVPTGGSDARLEPSRSVAEAYGSMIDFNATGFTPLTTDDKINGSGQTYVYIAIRRGPMKVPTSGTSVFAPVAASSGTQTTGFPVDMQILSYRSGTDAFLNHQVIDRLRGVSSTSTPQGNYLNTTSTAAESNVDPFSSTLMSNVGFQVPNNYAGTSSVFQSFQRAPSFFDEVCYTGDNAFNRAISHNLAAVPELVITKVRSTTANWAVYCSTTGLGYPMALNTTAAASANPYVWGTTAPTSTNFYIGDDTRTNGGGFTYVSYLFATCPGVSKVGSYTGTGTTQQINCGFTGGARFVLIKRTDSTGDWYVWDSARGIVAGNDPYLLLNSTAAEVTSTDYVDTYSAGFEITSTAPAAINASGGTFIFLAIA